MEEFVYCRVIGRGALGRASACWRNTSGVLWSRGSSGGHRELWKSALRETECRCSYTLLPEGAVSVCMSVHKAQLTPVKVGLDDFTTNREQSNCSFSKRGVCMRASEFMWRSHDQSTKLQCFRPVFFIPAN